MPENHVSPPRDVLPPDRAWHLPALSGRRAKLVLAAYAVTALVILTVIAGSFWFNARDYFVNIPTAAEYGFRTRTNDGVPVIATVARREPGRADLREEDRILSIDGIALPVDATEFTVAERLNPDEDGRATIVTRSTDGAVRTHVIDRIPVTSSTIEPSARMPLWLFIGIGFTSGQLPLLVWFGASLFLAWRRPRDSEAMLLAFAFLLLCITRASAFWLNAFAGLPWKTIIITENLAASVTMLAIAAFPDGRFINILSRLAVLLIGVLSILVILAELTNLPYRVVDGTALVSVVMVLASVWQRYRHTADQTQRQQIKWAVFGFCAAMLLFLPVLLAATAGIIPDDGPVPIILYQVIVQFGWLLIPIGLLISLMKFRLYDADAAISRSAAYATLTLVLAALFAASAEALEWLFQANFDRDAGALPNAIAAGVAVLAITPLNSRIQKWAEWRFQRDLVRVRRDLPDCVADMREISSLERLLETILEKVVAGVHAERAAILIGRDVAATQAVGEEETRDWVRTVQLNPAVESLDCDRDDDMFPMRVPLRIRHDADGNFGWLLLGPRPDDSFYGRDELDALAELADPIARGVQIVLVREAREAEADRQRAAQEDRISVLEKGFAEVRDALAKLPPRPTG